MILIAAIGPMLGALACGAERPTSVSEPTRDSHGFLVHRVVSPFQAGRTEIRVLLPAALDPNGRAAVVYVLPVEARGEQRFGDGLLDIQKQSLHERFPAIFVAPSFGQLPWYADHPTDPEIRQERYFLEVVIPFIERQYPARTDREGRLLVGFSKSGWGAYSLLLRHPDRFGKAAAWDAPLMQGRPDRFGMGAIFGTQENFEQYRITTLLERSGGTLGPKSRLILLGYGNFREPHTKIHDLMVDLKLPHVYHDGPKREHIWESGWLVEAVELLLGDEREKR